jgi:hypothetical protein
MTRVAFLFFRKVAIVGRRFVGWITTFTFSLLYQLARGSYIYRVPVLLGIFSFIVLSQPGQIQELYVLTLGPDAKDWFQICLIDFLALLLSFTLLVSINLSSRQLSLANGRSIKSATTVFQIMSGLLPIMGIQAGVYLATQTHFNDNFTRFYTVFVGLKSNFPDDRELKVFDPALTNWHEFPGLIYNQLLFSSILGIVVFIFVLTPYSRRTAKMFFDYCVEQRASFASSMFYRFVILLTIVLVIIFSLPNNGFAIEVPRFIGGLAIILMFLVLLSVHVSALSEIGDRTGVPILAICGGLAFVFSYFDLNDNHVIRSHLVSPRHWIKGDAIDFLGNSDPNSVLINEGGTYYIDNSQPSLPQLQDAFVAWFRSRPVEVKARFSGKPYPVYIVAAEGGGIYAAAQTAIFLARLLDRCPSISHHIFAISSVSGGSLGASVVAALIAERMRQLGADGPSYFISCPGKPPSGDAFFESSAKRLVATDHLAPSIGAGLFPDFLQRFLPVRIEAFDRARALERSIEQSWSKLFPQSDNPFTKNFRDSWSSSKNVPMLLLNTTIVQSGRQAVVAPVASWNDEISIFGGTRDTHEISSSYDIPLSTAVGLSARFTAVAPAGYHIDYDFPVGNRRSARLVDGGYIDNSGVETASSAARTIVESMMPSPNADGGFNSIDRSNNLLIVPQTNTKDDRAQNDQSQEFFDLRIIMIGTPGGGYLAPAGLNEFGSPVAAMLNSRVQRAERAINAVTTTDQGSVPVGIAQDYFNPPLGWAISPYTIDMIGAYIGTAERCTGAKESETNDPAQSFAQSFQGRVAAIAPHSELFPNEPRDRPTNFLMLWDQLRKNHCSACSIIQRAQGKDLEPSREEVGEMRPYGWYPFVNSCSEEQSTTNP